MIPAKKPQKTQVSSKPTQTGKSIVTSQKDASKSINPAQTQGSKDQSAPKSSGSAKKPIGSSGIKASKTISSNPGNPLRIPKFLYHYPSLGPSECFTGKIILFVY